MSDCNGFIDACTKRQQERCSHGRNNDVGRCIACVIDEAMEQLGEQEIERLERELNEARANNKSLQTYIRLEREAAKQQRERAERAEAIAQGWAEAADRARQPDAFYNGYSEGTMRAMQAMLRTAEAKLTECMAHADSMESDMARDGHLNYGSAVHYRAWRAKQ